MSAFKFCPACAAPLSEQRVENEERRACSLRCGFVLYDNPTPVVAAVVEHDGRVVLARNRSWPVPFYGLISGFLERGETPERAVLREVEEELGLKGDSGTLIGVYAFPEMNQVIIAYHVEAHGTIVLGDELVDFKRVALPECRAWPAGTGFALRDWLRSRGHEPEMIDISGWKKG
ncbi:NUDIX domain-containing protein [Pendulispora albinea]|uniref:NUDIX hydrolase n=1 Tax=Pendulispora albinea TaxID=2741071 RepID=A0ABZ2LM36_9BACT